MGSMLEWIGDRKNSLDRGECWFFVPRNTRFKNPIEGEYSDIISIMLCTDSKKYFEQTNF